jgi:hypothetical protein
MFSQGIKIHEVPLNKRQWKAFEDIIGSAKYFAFVAQDGNPHDLLVLAAEARAIYRTWKPSNLKEDARLSKVTQLSVIWNSAASICVSFSEEMFL